MKKFILLTLAFALSLHLFAQEQTITKTGYNFGPLPVVAYDADKGFQYGGLVNIFNYGDGTNYPNYDSKTYVEFSAFTKGSKLIQVAYDNKSLIPGVRWSSAAYVLIEKAMDFYGFNGYGSYFDWSKVAAGKSGDSFIYTPYYRRKNTAALFKTDFIGRITDNLKWEAGYHLGIFKSGAIDRDNINKGKKDGQKYPDEMPTLFEQYKDWGLIGANEADGGVVSSVRLGIVYDSRDKEGAPARGIWAEAHLTAAPKWLGSTNGFYRYSATWRHYLPIVDNNVLTFAYRLNYEGTFGSNAPFYVLPYITVMGENTDKDGMGGYRTVRGMLRDRVVGLDMATANLEMRWRFVNFTLGKQNISLGLSVFSDMATATRGRYIPKTYDEYISNGGKPSAYKAFADYRALSRENDRLHVTAGAGFRFIMNENFIVAVEYGAPLSRFYSNSSPMYNQDGTGAFYINTGYLF